MSEDNKPVPEPGEAQREDGDVRYFETDETNVSGATGSPADERPRVEGEDQES